MSNRFRMNFETGYLFCHVDTKSFKLRLGAFLLFVVKRIGIGQGYRSARANCPAGRVSACGTILYFIVKAPDLSSGLFSLVRLTEIMKAASKLKNTLKVRFIKSPTYFFGLDFLVSVVWGGSRIDRCNLLVIIVKVRNHMLDWQTIGWQAEQAET